MIPRHAAPRHIVWVSFLATVLAFCGLCQAWAHQGHILLTRLAALRIIDDPTAPKGLRDFLKANMDHTLADCEALAEVQYVGPNPQDLPQFDTALDKWCTMPDRMKAPPEGLKKIEPYGMPETFMHRLDLEVFSNPPIYKDDLSGKPDVSKIPHDLKDPRWKRAGFLPWRVEEMYHRLVKDFGPGDGIADPDQAQRDAGYLAHYVEDSTQPHHATLDYQSQSYLAGHVAGMPASTQPITMALALLHLPLGVNPHGDLEYELFLNTDEPRATLRKEFWKELTADIDDQSAESASAKITAENFDPFRWDLDILSDSYDYLPFIGRAVQAGYSSGKFDPAVFFNYSGSAKGKTMTIVSLIARQNAEAVLNVEMVYRLAWDEAHSAAKP
jgi:hypothetical protein